MQPTSLLALLPLAPMEEWEVPSSPDPYPNPLYERWDRFSSSLGRRKNVEVILIPKWKREKQSCSFWGVICLNFIHSLGHGLERENHPVSLAGSSSSQAFCLCWGSYILRICTDSLRPSFQDSGLFLLKRNHLNTKLDLKFLTKILLSYYISKLPRWT